MSCLPLSTRNALTATGQVVVAGLYFMAASYRDRLTDPALAGVKPEIRAGWERAAIESQASAAELSAKMRATYASDNGGAS